MGTYSRLDEGLRRVVARVSMLNLTYFGVEFSVALAIGSVSLFADSIDFLEDTSINFLILIALGWSAGKRITDCGLRILFNRFCGLQMCDFVSTN